MMYSINKSYFRPSRVWRQVAALILPAMLPVFVHAQVLTPDSIFALIRKNNPALQEYGYKSQALNQYAEGATSWTAPMVGAGTFMTPYPGQETAGDAGNGSWMLSLEQEIPNPAKLNARRDYLRSLADVEEQNFAIRYNELKAEARTLYYEWLVAEKKLAALNESEKIIALMLKLARIRYEYNQASLGSIYQAEGKLHQVRNKQLMTLADIKSNRYRLKALMALGPADSIMIDTAVVMDFPARDGTYDTAMLRSRRSDLKKIDETIEAMRLNQEFERAQARPDFRIRFDHMQPFGSMPAQFSAMAMISIPIAPWSSRQYRSSSRAMQYEIEAMKESREAIVLKTAGLLAGMTTELVSLRQQLSNFREHILPALRKNYQAVMLAYEENREQLPLVIDAWEALNMAQMDYLEKMDVYYKTIIEYEKELEK